MYTDETVDVNMIFSNAVYLPENLSLEVSLIGAEQKSTYNAMTKAVRDVLDGKLADTIFCRLMLQADGQPYQLPADIQVDVIASFTEPVVTADTEKWHTFILTAEDGNSRNVSYEAVEMIPDDYRKTEEGMTNLYFSSNRISAFAVAASGDAQKING